MRVDRTDPSKNIVRGFRAYELLPGGAPRAARARRHARAPRPVAPGHPRVLGVPRRDPARGASRERPFPHRGLAPLEVRIEDNFQQAVAAYKQYDVLLVNAIFDGMNLVAKEAPLVNTRDGVLVLSENAGAHDELGEWALTVNPFDLSGQAEAPSRGAHHGRGRATATARRRSAPRSREHDIAAWIDAQLADLDAVEHGSGTRLPV